MIKFMLALVLFTANLSLAEDVGFNASTQQIADPSQVPIGCTFTQGYWKNHDFNVASLLALHGGALKIGNPSYDSVELHQFLVQPPSGGDALIQLVHQLIAAKLNQLSGASVPSLIQVAISDSDNVIGNLVARPLGIDKVLSNNPLFSEMNTLATNLDNYNQGNAGVPHCNPSE